MSFLLFLLFIVDTCFASPKLLPYAEYEPIKYVALRDPIYDRGTSVADDLEKIKKKISQLLPEDVEFIVYTNNLSSARVDQIHSFFSSHQRPDQIHIMKAHRINDMLWARDVLPLPIKKIQDNNNELRLVSAKTPGRIEKKFLKSLFDIPIYQNKFFFSGGNFIANSLGDCVIIDRQHLEQVIPSSYFSKKYGCKKMHRLPHLKGIGHADEAVKFLNDSSILTDVDEYASYFKAHGFDVTEMPRPKGRYANYLNAIILNDTILVPQFEQSTDQRALEIYSDFGYKVFGIQAPKLFEEKKGALHCMTMTYPEATLPGD